MKNRRKTGEKRSRQTIGWRIGGIALSALLLAGCGSSYDNASYSGARAQVDSYNGESYATDDVYTEEAAYDYDVDYDDYDDDAPGSSSGAESLDNTSAQSNRKLIRRVSLTAETTEFEALIANLTERVNKLGGYIENSDIYGGGIYDGTAKSAEYTIRIPSEKLDSFVDAVAESSNVTHKSQSAEDITLQYVDVESKKEALRVEEKRLLALLEEADSIESIVTLESRLSDVRYELQSMESRLRTYDNQVDYATVNLTIREVEIYTPEEPRSRWEELATGFVGSIKGVGNGIVDFVIGFIIALPYLVVWGIVIAVIVWIIRKLIKRKAAKKERKQALLREQEEKKQALLRGQEERKKENE
ncbi:MAG: DUF4349 domain-containing protein [Lachnospiraceae bacterium]|nr:DUF4349 domain-containing protein [Lachnospiraceae bacterium]